MAKTIGAILTLKDNMSATLRGIKKEQKAFKRDVANTRKELERTFKKKYEAKLHSTAANKKIKQLRKSLDPLRKKVVTTIAYKDMISKKIKITKNKLKTIGKMTVEPVVKIKNKTSSVLGEIKNKILNLKTLAGSLILGLGTTSMLKSGANLEQQQISMKHFIGINNKNKSDIEISKMRDDYIKQLRNNANATPFETSDVISAGTRALGVVGGDIKQAMNLVKVAEDMAALTPGKTIQDAMEALADAKNGEMERLKEFNAKVSADEFKKLGFKGVVDKKLKSQFEGGSSKLSQSSAGLFSTIKGKLSSVSQDTGLKMLEKLKPTLQDIIGFIDKVSPKLQEFGTKMAEGFGYGINYVKTHWPQIKSTIKELNPVLDIVKSSVQLLVNAFKISFPIIKSIVSSVWKYVKPILEKVASGIDTVANILGKIGIGGGKKASSKSNAKTSKTTKQNALGTSYYTGGTVDENGGEIKILPNGTKVIPHDVSVKAIAGSTNNFNININGSNLTVDDVINQLVPKLKLAISNM